MNELLTAERAKDEVRDIETRMIGAAIRYVRLGYWRGAISLTPPVGQLFAKLRYHLPSNLYTISGV